MCGGRVNEILSLSSRPRTTVVNVRLRVFLIIGFAVALLATVPFATSASDPAEPDWIVPKEGPVAGKRFTAFVQVWSEEARARYESVAMTSSGALWPKKGSRMLRTLASEVVRLPEGAPVPKVVVWTWMIPPKTAGMRFGAGCSSTATIRTPEGVMMQHADGVLQPSWTIRRA